MRRSNLRQVEVEFFAAMRAEQEHSGGPVVEICAVLNRLPHGLLDGPDDQVIDEVDALMDKLYRRGQLVCPGHRWLSGPPPTSIRGHLVSLHARGRVTRHAVTGQWKWVDVTSYFARRVRGGHDRADSR